MCDERERLIEYLYDACDAGERRVVERHLAECESCRDEISGLRAVRLDLLAWDVPEHGSVWKPFAPARLRPWYREIPVWALAAAASVTFVLGLTGGLIAHRLAPAPRAAAVAPAPMPSIAPQVTPIPTNADMAALEKGMEKRIMAALQTQMDQRLQPVAAHAQAVSSASAINRDEILQEMQRMVTASESRVMGQLLRDSQRMYVTRSTFNNFRNGELPALVATQLSQQASRQ